MQDEAGTAEIIDDTNAPQFSAFISYSHADAAKVRKLHSQIESYRLPPDLGRIDALNRRKGRIGKVFRDREDLSAAQDLSTAVKDALDRSQVLVVACSPDAKASQWVDQEIAYFRERHPDRPVLAAILRGEPGETFPSALTEGGAEPLAADLRKQGDGWRLGFLKVVAGIAGVPLDRLVQRDSQRQLRRVMAVTGLVALVAVAMGVMTMIALQARNEAEAQRQEAEGLVGYMITDLREDLREVGRLDTMAGVSSRALEYYESEADLSSLGTPSLLLRVKALLGLGEDLLKHTDSDKEEVQKIFVEAYRTTGALIERHPDDSDVVFQHAQSAYWVGQSHYFFRDWEKTDELWTEYLELAERLDGFSEGTDTARKEIGYAVGNLCTLALHRDDRKQSALAKCQRAADIFERLARRNPDDDGWQSRLANRLGWLADALVVEGEAERALAAYRRQHQIAAELHAKSPEDASRVDQLMRAKMTLSEALRASGEAQEAVRLSSQATRLADEMVRSDPRNQYWRDWLERSANSNGGT